MENFKGLQYNREFNVSRVIDNKFNVSSPINCDAPSIIYNPRWYEYVYKFHELCLDGEVYSTFQFRSYPKEYVEKYIREKYQVTIDNYHCYCILRGNLPPVPIFYLVPCGKCHCCVTMKSNEYAFRSICETAVHSELPLFVTLTYRDDCLPKNGVEVEHVQLFFKRLRFHLSDIGLPSNFRYLCTSEYGKKSGRPHYHFIIWNYPYSQFLDKDGNHNHSLAVRPFYKSWKHYMLFNGKRKYHRNGKPAMRSLGMIKVLPVANGCTAYITKYFRKEDHNIKNYPNKTFLLSSKRNGGIGSQYIRSKYDEVFANRGNVHYKLSVFDKISQRVHLHSIGGYIKNLLFKSRSQILPKKMYDKINRISLLYHHLKASFMALKVKVLPINFDRIAEKLHHYIYKYPPLYYAVNYKYIYTIPRKELLQDVRKRLSELVMLYVKLDFRLLEKADEKLNQRVDFLESRMLVERNQVYNMVSNYQKYRYNYVNYCNRTIF